MDSTASPATVYRKPKVLWSRLKWRWPFLVWILACVAGWWTFNHGGRLERSIGAFEYQLDPILSLEEAHVKKILVTVGQEVKAGQPLVELDTNILDQEIADAQASIANDNEKNRLAIVRTYQSTGSSLEREIRDLSLRQAEDEGRLKTLREQIGQVEKMVNSGGLTRDVLVRLQADLGGLEKSTALLPTLLTQANESLTQNKASLAKELGALQAPVAPVLALKARRDAYTLRAPRDGLIHAVYARDGQVVLPRGQPTGSFEGSVVRPILEVAALGSTIIHAFVSEDSKIQVVKDQVVTIYDTHVKGRKLTAKIATVSSYIETLPDRGSPVANRFIHGRAITLIPEANHGLVPGQLVSILYTEPSWLDLVTH